MKVGDVIKVSNDHWSDAGSIGILLEDIMSSRENKAKAFRVLFSTGKIKTKLSKHMELIIDK